MIEKIKYGLHQKVSLSRVRIPLIAALVAVSIGIATLLGYSVKTVRISDGEKTYLVHSLAGNVPLALNAANLRSANYRITSLAVTASTTSVSIEYTFPVYITIGDTTTEFETAEATVAEILAAAGHTLDADDMVEPSANTVIRKTAYIDYTDIAFVSGDYTEAIPCGTDTVYAADKEQGTQITEAGTDGVQLVSYTSKIVNGETVETTVDNTTVLTAAVNARQIVGTKQPAAAAVLTSTDVSSVSTLTPDAPIELDANGNPVNYSKHLTVKATAYTYTGHNCSTGVAPQPGYIAVNPSFIPYGTKMYIKSSDGRYVYGYAIAADTGGFTKSRPTNVDLFMSSLSACYAFGNRNVEIYIIG